jgi:K+-sensing histidine kinase KdpD
MSSSGQGDAKWPKLLSLTVHEFRTPMTVVSGYLRMLLKGRAGPVPEQQRRLLEEAEKSCTRLSALLAEVSELSALEGGTATFNRAPVDLRSLLREAIEELPDVPDREIRVELTTGEGPAVVEGDATRLRTALRSVVAALRREVVASDRLLVREQLRRNGARACYWIAIADDPRVALLSDASESGLTTFDEWRGGCGLSLAVARRVIAAHGGRIWSPVEDSKAGAVIALPQADHLPG